MNKKINKITGNKAIEELKFWEQNNFNISLNHKVPNKVPNIKHVTDILKHVKETRDYYAIVERIKILKQKRK